MGNTVAGRLVPPGWGRNREGTGSDGQTDGVHERVKKKESLASRKRAIFSRLLYDQASFNFCDINFDSYPFLSRVILMKFHLRQISFLQKFQSRDKSRACNLFAF
jgi:hypothetical protein